MTYMSTDFLNYCLAIR